MRTDSARRSNGRDVGVLLGGVYAVMQLLIMPIARHPAWDEAIYLSQVTPGAGGTPFAPSRARGISLLVAPFAGVGLPLTITRAVLIVLSAAVLFVVFSVGDRSSASPRRPSRAPHSDVHGWPSSTDPRSCQSVGGVHGGRLSRSPGASRRRFPATARGSAGGDAPRPDGAVPALRCADPRRRLGRARDRSPSPALARADAGRHRVCGRRLPWVVEMSIRYGNPLAAIRGAGETGHVSAGSFVERLHQFVLLGDGPLIGPQSGGGIPVLVVAWLAVIGVLMWLGIRWSVGVRRTGIVLPRCPARASSGATPCLWVATPLDSSSPGWRSSRSRVASASWRSGSDSRAGASAAVLVAGMWIVSHVMVASDLGRASAEARDGPAMVGRALRDLSQQPCSVGGVDSFPEIAYASGCSGSLLTRRSFTRGDDARGSSSP